MFQALTYIAKVKLLCQFGFDLVPAVVVYMYSVNGYNALCKSKQIPELGSFGRNTSGLKTQHIVPYVQSTHCHPPFSAPVVPHVSVNYLS